MRDPSVYALFAPLQTLPGIGPKLAEVLAEVIGGDRVIDLLLHLPVEVQLRREATHIADLKEGELATVTAYVHSAQPGQGSVPHKVRLMDETGFLTTVFFSTPFERVTSMLPTGSQRVVSGRVELFRNERQMTHPDFVADPQSPRALHRKTFEPIYRLGQGITAWRLNGFIETALQHLPDLREWIDAELVRQQGWPAWQTSLLAEHKPQSVWSRDVTEAPAERRPHRERLAYDEAFARQLAFGLARLRRKRDQGLKFNVAGDLRAKVLAGLPYSPTQAQNRAVNEAVVDMQSGQPMHRLLQGDVGAGKTLVAALLSAEAAEAGYLAAFMAPTEVLARQQASVLTALLAPAGIKVAVLTGRDRGKARAQMIDQLRQGTIQVVCGTQALFSQDVELAALGLVIIDEQHRFGVNDRLKLMQKGQASHKFTPHVLAMSATPIPRSLALAAFGDLDVSVLDEKPAGRKPIQTRAVPVDRLEDVLAAMRRAVERGEQAFWICPSVEGEADEAAAIQRQAFLSSELEMAIGLVHGRMKAREKDKSLESFRNGQTRVLVATTVVEVGVDIPEATIMVIEGAERFGLAQLHQLRGRVGRGSRPSSCLLVYSKPLGAITRERLDLIRRSEDGFELAEADFRLRGPGDVLGLRQSGIPQFRILELSLHSALLAVADKDARLLLAKDPNLSSERGVAARFVLDLLGPKNELEIIATG